MARPVDANAIPFEPFEYEIGTRVVGGRYHSGYWNQEYEVLEIRTNVPVWGWEISVRWRGGRNITHHSTAWNYRRDRVLKSKAQPALYFKPDTILRGE